MTSPRESWSAWYHDQLEPNDFVATAHADFLASFGRMTGVEADRVAAGMPSASHRALTYQAQENSHPLGRGDPLRGANSETSPGVRAVGVVAALTAKGRALGRGLDEPSVRTSASSGLDAGTGLGRGTGIDTGTGLDAGTGLAADWTDEEVAA